MTFVRDFLDNPITHLHTLLSGETNKVFVYRKNHISLTIRWIGADIFSIPFGMFSDFFRNMCPDLQAREFR
jgi:hypothetical protein